MNKQDLIDMAKKERYRWDFDWGTDLYSKGRYLSMEVALEGMEKLDEPELPVIPQFVAEWIVDYKERYDFRAIIQEIEMTLVNLDVDMWIENNFEKFSKAWLDGYKIEKEPEWIVKLEKGRYVDNFIKNTVGIEIDITSKLDYTAPIRFKDKAKAEAVALLVGGKAEDVPDV